MCIRDSLSLADLFFPLLLVFLEAGPDLGDDGEGVMNLLLEQLVLVLELVAHQSNLVEFLLRLLVEGLVPFFLL